MSSVDFHSEVWQCPFCAKYNRIQYVSDDVVEYIAGQKCVLCGEEFDESVWTFADRLE